VLGRSALQKEHRVIVADPGELTQKRDRLGLYRLVIFAAMRVLHHAHSGAGEIEELGLRALERGERKSGGTSVEIDDSGHGMGSLGW